MQKLQFEKGLSHAWWRFIGKSHSIWEAKACWDSLGWMCWWAPFLWCTHSNLLVFTPPFLHHCCSPPQIQQASIPFPHCFWFPQKQWACTTHRRMPLECQLWGSERIAFLGPLGVKQLERQFRWQLRTRAMLNDKVYHLQRAIPSIPSRLGQTDVSRDTWKQAWTVTQNEETKEYVPIERTR